MFRRQEEDDDGGICWQDEMADDKMKVEKLGRGGGVIAAAGAVLRGGERGSASRITTSAQEEVGEGNAMECLEV